MTNQKSPKHVSTSKCYIIKIILKSHTYEKNNKKAGDDKDKKISVSKSYPSVGEWRWRGGWGVLGATLSETLEGAFGLIDEGFLSNKIWWNESREAFFVFNLKIIQKLLKQYPQKLEDQKQAEKFNRLF